MAYYESLTSSDLHGIILLCSATNGKLLHKLKGHTDDVLAVRFARNGKTLVSVSKDRTVRTWDITSGRETHKLELQGPVDEATISADGSTLAVSSTKGPYEISIWNLTTGRKTRVLEDTLTDAAGLALSENGRVLAASACHPKNPKGNSWADCKLRLWDTATGAIRFSREDPAVPFRLAISPDGHLLGVAHSGPGHTKATVDVWQDTRSAAPLASISYPDEFLTSLAFTPGGHELAASWDGVYLYNPRNGRQVAHLKRSGEARFFTMDFTLDGKGCWAAGPAYTVERWMPMSAPHGVLMDLSNIPWP